MASSESQHDPGNERGQRLVAAARRIVPLAATASTALRRLAITGAVAAIVISVLLVDPIGSGAWRWAVACVFGALLLVPAAVLFVFDQALRDLRELPAKLRDLPQLATAQRDELTRLAQQIRSDGAPGRGTAVRSLWSLARTLLPVWDLLTGVVPSARILLPPFGLLAILSAVACLVEIMLALVIVLATIVV